jgi:hypothetical protein
MPFVNALASSSVTDLVALAGTLPTLGILNTTGTNLSFCCASSLMPERRASAAFAP